MMSLGTSISIGLLVLWTATIAMAAGLNGWKDGQQESDEAAGAACTGGDPFTLSGFAGNSTHDGCYMISCSNSNLWLYTLNGQEESLGGLIVSAPEHDDSTHLVSPNVLRRLCLGACEGKKKYNKSTSTFTVTHEKNATYSITPGRDIGLGGLIMDGRRSFTRLACPCNHWS